jgi:hypothetical protein
VARHAICREALLRLRLGEGYDLGKVEDEEHLLLVCPNTQKVRECFCLALPHTYTNILVELM